MKKNEMKKWKEMFPTVDVFPVVMIPIIKRILLASLLSLLQNIQIRKKKSWFIETKPGAPQNHTAQAYLVISNNLLFPLLLQPLTLVVVEMAGYPGPDGEDGDGGQDEGQDGGPPHPGLLQSN